MLGFKTRSATSRRSSKSVLAAAFGGTLLIATGAVAGQPAAAAPAPIVQRSKVDVTADALPTAQINGVAWSQVIIGYTVYVGGQFTSARPAGAPAGTDETPRTNLLAYDLRTGELLDSFAPEVNGPVLSLAKSTDSKTLFIGGDFTQVAGKDRLRLAAFSTSTGSLRKLAPQINGKVRALTASSSRLYVGGSFTKVGSKSRSKAAAFGISSRKLLSWAPKADNYVSALTLTPNKKSVVLGGSFLKIGTHKVYGMASVDYKSAKVRTWKINKDIRDYGSASAITSLSADKHLVYGSGYSYGEGNFEGAFAANPKTGAIVWVQDCRGDTYDVAVTSSRLYSVGHAHFCGNIGGFPDSAPVAYRALSVTLDARGTVAAANPNPRYNKLEGRPAPALLNWFPELAVGEFTGQSQSAWSTETAHGYLVLGGEFPSVNGVPQQGLVRFSLPANAPLQQGPLSKGRNSTATIVAGTDPTTATVSWKSNYDRDDENLSYQIKRDGVVVHNRSATSQFWNRPVLSFVDTGLVAGTTYSYVVEAKDPDGNVATSDAVSFTAPTA